MSELNNFDPQVGHQLGKIGAKIFTVIICVIILSFFSLQLFSQDVKYVKSGGLVVNRLVETSRTGFIEVENSNVLAQQVKDSLDLYGNLIITISLTSASTSNYAAQLPGVVLLDSTYIGRRVTLVSADNSDTTNVSATSADFESIYYDGVNYTELVLEDGESLTFQFVKKEGSYYWQPVPSKYSKERYETITAQNDTLNNQAVSFLNQGVQAASTITLPQNPVDGQVKTIVINNTITTLTINSVDGSGIVGTALTTAVQGTYIKFIYVKFVNNWYRIL